MWFQLEGEVMFLNVLVVHVLEVWLLSLLGLHPSGDWDESDPNCLRFYGPYTVYTVQAHISDPTAIPDEAALLDSLERFLAALNKFLPVKLYPYRIERYHGDSLYVSVYCS